MKSSGTAILRFLWRTSRPYKWRRNFLILTATLNFVVGMFVIPLIVAAFLELVQTNQLSGAHAGWLITSYAVAQLWSEVIGWRVAIYLLWTLNVALQRDVSTRIFDKITHQTMFFHVNRFSGSLVSQTNKLTGSIDQLWNLIVWSVLPVVVSIVGSVIVLWFIFWQYALFLALLSIAFGVAVFFGSRHITRLNEQEAAASNAISGRLSDAFSNIMAVKAYSAEQYELHEFEKTVNTWRGVTHNLMRSFLKASSVYAFISGLIRVGALVFALIATQQHIISIAAIYLVVTYTASVAHNLWNMSSIMRTYSRIIGDSHAMVDILQQPTTLTDASQQSLRVRHGGIVLNKVTFTHDEGKGARLFHSFSLTIQPGERIGLVGASGSGKTTLTKLLLRFADIDSGEITIDGQNIAMVTQASLRSQIAYVPQEPLLFHRSIRDNIAYAQTDATDQQVKAAAQKAGAYDFIINLRDGFDTLVGERGVKLSGGQRQRIAIARAILKNAPILVLDEATSALDSESEKLIQQSLETLMKDRTAIVIAHRLSTIAKLDRIVVLDDGRIVEDGTHDELLARKGHYAKLWQHQSGGFLTTDESS